MSAKARPARSIRSSARLFPRMRRSAEAVGLSRPQITNVINGRFGASRRVVRRVLELATAA